MERTSFSLKFPIGSELPNFILPSTSGEQIGKEYFAGAKGALVVFTCNHCPYVKGSEKELISLVSEFQALGLKAVFISANDAVQYPDDSFDNMKIKAEQYPLPCPYLYDEAQLVAKSFDAQCTPEVYLFNADLKLAYHGAVNDSPRDSSNVKQQYLRKALVQVLEGGMADPEFAHPIGCSIKWK